MKSFKGESRKATSSVEVGTVLLWGLGVFLSIFLDT